MNNETPIPAPSLREYVELQQALACRLEGLIKALAILDAERASADATAALISAAQELATDLYRALDTVNLPEK